MTSTVKFLDLQKINAAHGDDFHRALSRVADSGWYLQGEENKAFEAEYAAFIGNRYAIGCGNGLDALKLIFKAYIELGRLCPGDEVIVPANTYIASILAISETGLVPVLVEPDIETLQLDDDKIEESVSDRTRAILIVHLYGRCAYTERIADICRSRNLLLFEDNAQAHGCEYRGRRTGSLGDAGAHSFYPGKNLGAMGDGGAVTTDNPEVADMVRALGNYGSSKKYVFDHIGYNSRLDELQAAILRVKLPFLGVDNDHRRHIADLYHSGINNPEVSMPSRPADRSGHVFHLFPVLCERRDELQRHLAACGVQTLIHYPIPPHKQKCYPGWNDKVLPVTERIHATELSLPISPVMTDIEAAQVIDAVNSFR